jgi:hypothetical protein
MPSLNYFDKDKQEWVAIPLGGGTDADLSAYATTEYVDGQTGEIKAAATVAFTERYTKQEVDAKVAALQQGLDDANLGVQGVADLVPFVAGELSTQIDAKLAGKADQSEFSAFQGQYGTLESEFREYFNLLNQGFATVAQKPDVDAALDLKADKAATYTKAEVDEAIGDSISGQLTQAQIEEIISQVGPVDLAAYAKISDNTQNLLARVVTAQGYGFGDKNDPPAALTYTDTGEGYGERLVLAAGSSIEYLVMKSDLDALFPAIDTSQFSTTITVAALDARINTLESTRATTTTTTSLDTRIKSLESKAAATSNINDASNAALKKSILDAVALMIAGGGKQPPADIDWTACRSENLSGNHPTAQARMIAGVIELRGAVAVNNLSSNSFFTHLPASFPLPELDIYVPVGARLNTGPAVAAFVTIDKSTRRIGFIAGSTISELHLTGVRVKAAY